ncbi:hypothetical protein E2C01_010455 [Portunus trituberculatus]|uniref:Uncharacterized protein n=1 Tax=Portunus trituberculatus TaxID=210409 RepID=A0A5B7D8G9_PORTR|nr:hypothetical protein [Portunus trituberculatus]
MNLFVSTMHITSSFFFPSNNFQPSTHWTTTHLYFHFSVL